MISRKHSLVLTVFNLLHLIQGENIIDFLRGREDLKEFLIVLQRPGLHKAYLHRQITIFVPTDAALLEYRGSRDEDFSLNHLVNSVEMEAGLGPRLSSLVTGGPPIWVTRHSAWLYFNQARAIERNIVLQLGGGEIQVVYIIDGVLEPLLPVSVNNASLMQDISAGDFLARSTLYHLGDDRITRVFHQAALQNKRDPMFNVRGRHTFFLPVDSAFKTIDRANVDAKIIEAHIVPNQLLLTTFIDGKEFGTVAYSREKYGVKVNVSLQASQAIGGGVMARSNTIVGDNFHDTGLVVSRIVKGNIPVQNGIIHLIDKPLMIVARSLSEYLTQEGSQPSNRLYRFAQLVRGKGGLFNQTILEARDGTLLAPSNEAFRQVDDQRLNFILANKWLREEFFGLHFTRERISSNKKEIRRDGPNMYSAPASWATNRLWFQYNNPLQKLTVEGRGVNATAVEKDIGTTNGVIHVIDRVLGIPFFTVTEKLRNDPDMKLTYGLALAVRLSDELSRISPRAKFTLIVPTNEAWEKVQRDFSQTFSTMRDGLSDERYGGRNFAMNVLRRHLIVADRAFTMEQLAEKSTREPSTFIPTEGDELQFSAAAGRAQVVGGDRDLNAYKEFYVGWGRKAVSSHGIVTPKVKGKIVRPNLECINGIIHLVDTVMMNDEVEMRASTTSGSSSLVSALLILLLPFINTV